MKKCLLVILLLVGLPASAQVVITEIMYDLEGSDTDREWIEVRNDGADIDFSTYKFFEANTNHALTPIQGGNSLAAGDYAVVALKAESFLADWPGFAGLLFDSSFSLSNTGETLAIKDADGNIINEVTYSSDTGATGDGKALSLIDGSFIAASPTPGSSNQDTGDSGGSGDDSGNSDDGGDSSESGDDSGGSSSSESSVQASTPKVYPYTAEIIAPAAGFAKVPIAFDSKVLGTKKEELTAGRYVWNLGDFTIRESAAREKFTHLYDWPGEYVVVLDYYKDAQTKESDASDRLVIKVSAFSVEITNVGLPPDVFVELSNKSAKEVNLSSFILGQDGKFFYIPQNTIILANKKMIIPAKITGFAGVNPAALFFPTGERAFLWPPPQVITPVLPPPAKKPIATAVSNKIEEDPPQILKTPPETAEAEDLLEAGAAKSGFAFNKNWLWILGVAGLVVLGLAAIFLLKEDKDDEDFTLVE